MGRRGSRIAGGALTAVVAVAVIAFWAGVAALFWQALRPYRLAAADLWRLIPAGHRDEAGLTIAIAGGVLLILLVVAGVATRHQPAPPPRGTSRRPGIGIDTDGDDTGG